MLKKEPIFWAIVADIIFTAGATLWLVLSNGVYYGGPPKLIILFLGIWAVRKQIIWVNYIFMLLWAATGLVCITLLIVKFQNIELWRWSASAIIGVLYTFGAWLAWKSTKNIINTEACPVDLAAV